MVISAVPIAADLDILARAELIEGAVRGGLAQEEVGAEGESDEEEDKAAGGGGENPLTAC